MQKKWSVSLFFLTRSMARPYLVTRLLLAGGVGMFFSPSSFATIPFMDSGFVLAPQKYEVSLHTQFITQDKKTTFNVIGQFDENPFQRKNFNLRYLIGGGESTFLAGSFFKWVPLTDYRYRPALGASVGVAYNYNWQDNKTHYVSLHFRPVISKELGTIVGKFIPYLAFPLSMEVKNFSELQFPGRLTVGLRGELFFIYFHKFEFNVEFSKDVLEKTPSYFTAGIITHW